MWKLLVQMPLTDAQFFLKCAKVCGKGEFFCLDYTIQNVKVIDDDYASSRYGEEYVVNITPGNVAVFVVDSYEACELGDVWDLFNLSQRQVFVGDET